MISLKSRWLNRGISALVGLFMVAALVAGYGGVFASPAQAVTITHWEHQYDVRTKVGKELVSQFEGANSGAKVDFQPIPYDGYFDKLLTALASGSGPDVFKVPATMAFELIQGGVALPVPSSIYTVAQAKKDFLPWTTQAAIYNGKLYGLPTDVQTVVMFVNDKLYAEAGYTPKDIPTTWAEFNRQVKRLTKYDAEGKIDQAGVDTRYKWADYTLWLYQFTHGHVVDQKAGKVLYDGAAGLEAWNEVKTLMVDAKVDSPQFMAGQFKFEQNKAVFYLNHPVTRGRLASMAPNLKYTIYPVPSPDGKPSTIASSWLYMVNAQSKHPDLAWKWIKLITSEPAEREWVTKAGDLPALVSLVKDDSLFPTASDKVVQQSLNYVYAPQEVGGNDVDKIRQTIWDNIVIKHMPVDQAVKQGEETENQLIRQKLGK